MEKIGLVTTELEKKFGDVTAVDRVSLTFSPGEMVGIIGRSGAGKSTLLRLINRLIDPTSGEIWFGSKNICTLTGKALRDWRAKCGMIFQQFNLVDRMDVISNVLIGRLRYHHTIPTLLKLFPRKDKIMAIEALDRLGMADFALKRVDTLSGGQQQRVAITKALVQAPNVLLADEPIASLDPGNATIVMTALKSINEDYGITVICNLHHLDTARQYCHRIVGMQNGQVVFDGSPEELTPEKANQVYGNEGLEELREANFTNKDQIESIAA
ncbi:MAG: phosphonate ABC transporter ATP-binding protein [Desulfobacterales bacterium]|jgi:phosphonate transport system ATP-binding protein